MRSEPGIPGGARGLLSQGLWTVVELVLGLAGDEERVNPEARGALLARIARLLQERVRAALLFFVLGEGRG